MFNRILIVCVANICRSPMAEGLFKLAADKHGSNVEIESAGIHALVGYPAADGSKNMVASMNVDIASHRARQLNSHLVGEADLILVMESWQKNEVLAMEPACRGKIYTLGHWTNLEIEDPYKKSRLAYAEALGRIKVSVDSWSKKLW